MNDPLDQVRAVMNAPEDVALPQGLAPKQDSFASVTPLRRDRGPLKPRAQALLDATTHASHISAVLDRPYLVKGWLDQGGCSIMYAPPNVGKSFLGLYIAHSVAKGIECFGRKTRKGRVLLICAEGGSGVRNRIAALVDPDFFVMTVSVSLTGNDNAAREVVEVLRHLAEIGGSPFDLVIIDTMARVMGAADENTAEGIGALMRSVDLVRRMTGAHVMLIHHTGKDSARGARGHSALFAAIDTGIELTRDDETGCITAELTKQRDGPTGYRFSYRLRQVELGRDQDGDPVTTCVVEPTETAQAGRAVVSDAAQRALSILDRQLYEGGAQVSGPSYPGTPCIPLVDWREACLAEGGGVSSAKDREGRAKTFNRVRDDLEGARLILVRDDKVWRVQP